MKTTYKALHEQAELLHTNDARDVVEFIADLQNKFFTCDYCREIGVFDTLEDAKKAVKKEARVSIEQYNGYIVSVSYDYIAAVEVDEDGDETDRVDFPLVPELPNEIKFNGDTYVKIGSGYEKREEK